MAVVLVLVLIIFMIGAPPLQRLIVRNHLEGVARETSLALHRARAEAIKRGVEVVVKVDYATNEVFAFADVINGTAAETWKFNPDAALPYRASDYEIFRYPLPNQVSFWGGGDASPEGPEALTGFTVVPGEVTPAAIFDPDGSIDTSGALRFGDNRGNHLEVRVAPESTARVSLRKYNPDLPPADDGTLYHEQGKHPLTGEPTWEWYL